MSGQGMFECAHGWIVTSGCVECIRAEAKAEGAAEERERIATLVQRAVAAGTPWPQGFVDLIRGSAPAPADDAQAKALALIRTIASKEHFEECDYSALDYGESVEPGAMCTCCQSCTDDRDAATQALALLGGAS